MKALVKTQKGVGFIEVRDVPEPTPGPGEVKIKVEACGICGSDIHVRHDSFPYWPPVILGHEFTGTVVELGPDCQHATLGDRIVAEPHTLACGQCALCRTGNVQICPSKRSPGWGIDGGMAEYICYPERLLHTIPDDMSWDQAAVVEPTANAVTDLLLNTRVTPGDTVVVLGPGPIGLMSAMVARAAGATQVIIIGTPGDVDLRIRAANELGFADTVVLGEQDPIAFVEERTNGLGADVVVECSGAPKGIASTVDFVRKRGKICAIGLTGNRPVELPWDKFQFKVVDVHFSLSTEYESWDRTIALIHSGLVPAEKLITHREPLENWEQVFDAIENLQALKGVLIPG
ncbi:MAG: alcohol dehydrogenase catalytic domain-containing protein [Lentisphaerae bacterium]|jgi:L-iditol 2-dehydrogenase|nr:alcohol dehydrogenase catalytic domain-containing protein [Lentisphaerota bacterium]MBT4818246.1 alcohol dehydrogenase catalytic domain-containing protein [Lentisphaerota bacterium]MBT7060359.1 alcohol dehydrogenase catalytic domain-containing protein [Lentisphaerota bacterium]MBT7844787.1 alcohol dehydrogenase catalytic domain-containing protein [Lentisphaerota bacterium]